MATPARRGYVPPMKSNKSKRKLFPDELITDDAISSMVAAQGQEVSSEAVIEGGDSSDFPSPPPSPSRSALTKPTESLINASISSLANNSTPATSHSFKRPRPSLDFSSAIKLNHPNHPAKSESINSASTHTYNNNTSLNHESSDDWQLSFHTPQIYDKEDFSFAATASHQPNHPHRKSLPVLAPSISVCPPSPVKPSTFHLNTSINLTNPFSPKANRTLVAPVNNSSKDSLSPYLNDFEELKLIGTGSFGRVFKCRNKIDGWLYAVKKAMRPVRNIGHLQHSLKEVCALAALGSHPHIVRYYRAWLEDAHLYIQMEYCKDGSLGTRRKKLNPEWTQAQLLTILRQVTLGLKHVHNHNMVHLDIKPDNIFVVSDHKEKVVYKIGDFGLTDIMDRTINSPGEISEGDAKYVAPELLQTPQDKRDLSKADIYSLGCSIYELAIGKSLTAEMKKDKVVLPERFSPEFSQLLSLLMAKDLELRPSASQVLRHWLLQSSNKQKLTKKLLHINELKHIVEEQRNNITQLEIELAKASELTKRMQYEVDQKQEIMKQLINKIPNCQV